jgi:non-ribosomal peptide synthetase component F
VYENYPIKEPSDQSWLRFEKLQSIERTDHPLTVFIVAREELRIHASYEVARFPRGAVQQVLRHLRCLLAASIANPETAIGQLPLMPLVERTRALVEWNATAADYPRDRCVHELFEAQVERTPEATAVVFGAATLSFRQLNERANQMAHFLRAQGIGAGDLVAVLVPRSAEMVAVLLGIWKTGAAYLPLDPAHPTDRVAFILADSRAKLVIQEHDTPDDSTPGKMPPVVTLEQAGLAIAAAPAGNPAGRAAPDRLAYVIYTSGSTGKPKGVPIEHRSFVNLLWAMRRRPGFSAADTLLAVTTLSFDISGLEVFLPLVAGGKLIIAPRDATTDAEALLQLLTTHAPTVMPAGPAPCS